MRGPPNGPPQRARVMTAPEGRGIAVPERQMPEAEEQDSSSGAAAISRKPLTCPTSASRPSARRHAGTVEIG